MFTNLVAARESLGTSLVDQSELTALAQELQIDLGDSPTRAFDEASRQLELETTCLDGELKQVDLLRRVLDMGVDTKSFVTSLDTDGSFSTFLGSDAATLSLEELQDQVEENKEAGEQIATNKKRRLIIAKVGAALAGVAVIAALIVKANAKGKAALAMGTHTHSPDPVDTRKGWDAKLKPIMADLYTLLDKARLMESLAQSDLSKPLPSLDVEQHDGNASSVGPVQYAEHTADAIKSAARQIRLAERKAKTPEELNNLKTLSDHVKSVTDSLKNLVDTKIYTVQPKPE